MLDEAPANIEPTIAAATPPAPSLAQVVALLARLVELAEHQHDEPAALLSATEAGHLAGLSRRKWQGLVASGRAPKGLKLGRLTRWRRDELRGWIAAGCPAASAWAIRQASKADVERFGKLRAG